MNTISNTPYDDVFRTMVTDLPRITLKLINEMFRDMLPEKYSGNEKVEQLANEQFLEQQDGIQDKRITDSRIKVTGKEVRQFHMECQSTTDGSIVIRLFEYDSQIALQDSVFTTRELIVNYPHSGILYLRWTDETPGKLRITINTPGGSVGYEVPVMKIADYSVEDVISKDLYFLIPFYLFKYEELIKQEKERKSILGDRLIELKEDYQKLRSYLEGSCSSGNITEYEKRTILDMSNKVVENLSQNAEIVRKEVENIMGGKVLEYEAKTIRNEGIAQGVAQGKEKGQSDLVRAIQELRKGVTPEKLLADGYDQHTIDLAITCK